MSEWIVQLFDYRWRRSVKGVPRTFYMGYLGTDTRERGREILRTLKPIGIEGYVVRRESS